METCTIGCTKYGCDEEELNEQLSDTTSHIPQPPLYRASVREILEGGGVNSKKQGRLTLLTSTLIEKI